MYGVVGKLTCDDPVETPVVAVFVPGVDTEGTITLVKLYVLDCEVVTITWLGVLEVEVELAIDTEIGDEGDAAGVEVDA